MRQLFSRGVMALVAVTALVLISTPAMIGQAPVKPPPKPPQQAAPANPIVDRQIQTGGTVVLRYKDGTIKTLSQGTTTTRYPNGQTTTMSAASAPVPDPPYAPGTSVENSWLKYVSDDLLASIQQLMTDPVQAATTVKASETAQHMSPYQQIIFRAEIIQRLLSQ